jgi:xanthine dehydrogenase large subunit
MAEPVSGGIRQSLAHDSAARHVAGEALYVDDLPELPGTLHAWAVLSTHAHAAITVDIGKARAAPNVAAVLTAADLPAAKMIGAIVADEPVLADGEVLAEGMPIAIVAAETRQAARDAAALIAVEYHDLPAILTIDDAIAAGATVGKTTTMKKGGATQAIAHAPRRLAGEIAIGGQEHFYLEGQVAYAIPREDGMLVHSSTQNPTEVQHLVARVLGVADAAVAVEIRRIGGGFGGKETQPANVACLAALLARATGRPVKWRLDRDDDMKMTGKRHDFRARWRVGFDDDGRLLGLETELAARCGYSADLSNAVVDRAMFHAENAYFVPHASVTAQRCRTHTASATAFRGFGGPQGMLAAEAMIDEVARALGRDPLDIRRRNLYGVGTRDETHYGQRVEDNILPELIDALEVSSDYRARRRDIDAFNRTSRFAKRGLALTPVKFGISFTATHLNQAGALIHLYTDGSVHLNHGGIEMGQGLNIKIAQIVAEELQLPIERIAITATTTGKVPNTSPTAASAGADLNGMAARAACRTLKERLAAFAAAQWKVEPESVAFAPGEVRVGDKTIPFAELVRAAYLARVPLSATGFYKTPKIWWDATTMRGRPFYYYTYGAAATEAEIDTLTGEYRFRRADLIQDVGASLNPAIDLGQTEGGYVQGLGWLTAEELVWDEAGRLKTHAPSTYKIPTSRDVPPDLRVTLFERPNREETIFRSKAVGEPPLMMAISGFLALKDAVSSVAEHRVKVRLDAPATPERILLACEAVRAAMPAELGKAAE